MHFKFQFLRIPSMSIAHHFHTHFSPVQFLIPSFPPKFMIYYNYFTHTYHTHRHTHTLQIYCCSNVHVFRDGHLGLDNLSECSCLEKTDYPSLHSPQFFFFPTVLVEVRLCEISSTHFGLTTGIVIMKIS